MHTPGFFGFADQAVFPEKCFSISTLNPALVSAVLAADAGWPPTLGTAIISGPFDTVKAFSQAIVQHLASVLPSRFVAKSGPSNRVGKVFADYLRNGHGATTAAAFSVRARPGLGVSMPVAWDALAGLKSGAHWHLANAREHLSFQKVDPWADYWTQRQSLTAPMKALSFKPPPRAARKRR